ncbi:structural basis For the activity of A cytoplasmic Rna terminal U transferase [Peziza echinospora]|nr:structural basis For the activity of A cytoplasmic Rna terminal U transferase [Peziza echinospora]
MATEQVDQSPQSWRPRKNIPTQNQQRCRGPNRGNVFRYPQHMPNARQMVAVRKLVQEQVALATMPPDEIERKRRCHERLQKVCQTVRPTAELVPFGSLVSGFAVVGSDLDLVLSDPSEPADGLQGFQIPILIEKALQADGMKTQLLTKTRVPILKVTQPATPDCPEAIAADIGFSNELAICNTQMLRTYSKCDSRVVDMVKFVKRWAKLRKINSAYKGTLSSYGYVLMVLHYLINIVEPPVLPNLQLHPVPLDTPKSEVESHGRNVWFYKDVDALEQSARNRKPSDNHMNVAELLLGLYDYYSYEFSWVKSVISLRTPGGLLTKIEKGWTSAKIKARDMETSYKDRYLFAIEDPFETTHNVSRTCTYNGVYLMRDEFKRAHQLLRCREGEEKLPTLFEEAPDHKWGQGPPRAVVPLPESDDPELLDMIIKKYYSNPKPTD